MAAAPWAGGDRVRRGPGGPQAETIVMLGRQNEPATAGLPGRARPLSCIERRGIEGRRIFVPVAPFAIGEGVHPEVEKERALVTLPRILIGRRDRAGSRKRSRNGPAQPRCGCGRRRSEKRAASEHWRVTILRA